MSSKRLALIFWVFCIHITGIYLFTRGFLLTRLSLPHISGCPDGECSLPPTHERAVVLIIDALRFDFVSEPPPTSPSPFHHNILTLPRELTLKHPKHSFLFNSYADPPTTTLQRIKGITTGSLPTFVDLGSNFGASSINEDSIMLQLRKAGKRAAFMGDDTWMSVFPDSFALNMTFPYDSFNVEDLHTVDNGVIAHLIPLMEDPSKPFDFLIGHFLGIDHVGHRLGPDHPSMRAKLAQMNGVLKRVVDLLDDDTLLVVLGDHGMDQTGDHGGDGNLETSSALWVYSKGPALTQTPFPVPPGLLQYKVFPGTTASHRAVQQIDLLPSLSLLLGLPVPYNNLGSVIPELFWRDRDGAHLEKALRINSLQIKSYLDTYRASPSGRELDDAWSRLRSAWISIESDFISREGKLVSLNNYNRVALAACRMMWAQFSPSLMVLGLSLLSMGVCATWAVYSSLASEKEDSNRWLRVHLIFSVRGAAVGALLSMLAYFLLATYLDNIDALDCVLFGASFASCLTLFVMSPPLVTWENVKATPIILILHALAFLSNSFTFWEDRIVPFFLVSSVIPYTLVGFRAPVKRLRYRILGFSLLFAVCVRTMAISTICREEQQPYCSVTYYASSSLPSPPYLALILTLPSALGLPWAIRRVLCITRNDVGLARPFMAVILAPSLLGGALYWIIEWIEAMEMLGAYWAPLLRIVRTWVARSALAWNVVVGGALWYIAPVCMQVQVQMQTAALKSGGKKQVTVLGFANALGAPYLLFWTLALCVVYICSQTVGQLVLILGTGALLAFLELLDSVRDVMALEAAFASATPSMALDMQAAPVVPLAFRDILPLALLGLHAFYGTGHQATISSIQWKAAFMVTPTLKYPFALATVLSNTFGPLFLGAFAAPLVGLWNRAPVLGVGASSTEVSEMAAKEGMLGGLGVMLYHGLLLLGTAVSAAVLRRHLMVWKVFAPRFMLGAVGLLVVDLAVLLGVGLGVERVVEKVRRMFAVGEKKNIGAFVAEACSHREESSI